ncbi:MAG TPA: hypothetical protein VFH68_23735 [Polyangia bacterium]|jgi:hypothetical protein|nr:hypothetical protein [Polyangia bacterium]
MRPQSPAWLLLAFSVTGVLLLGCGRSDGGGGAAARGGAGGSQTDVVIDGGDESGSDVRAGTRPCTGDDGCAGATPRCDLPAGRCAACRPDVDCVGVGVCDPSTGACVECIGDGDCSAPTATCDVGRHLCVAACRGSATCARGTVCDTQSGSCVGCVRNADCARGALCDRARGECVECLVDGDCPVDAPVCTPGHSCSDTCASDTDCQDGSGPGPPGNRSVCDPRSHLCADCLGNGDCGNDSFCRADGTCG